MAKRKEYTPEYKAKLVIEVFNVKQLGNWKSEFLENAGRAFSRSRDEKSAARQVAELHEKEKKYQAKIGQLTLENDFLKETAEKMLGPGWEDQLGY